MIEREQLRAGPVGSLRERVAPFSDEWRARQAIYCRLFEQPDGTPADGSATLPRFPRVTWSELRNAWRKSDYRKGQMFNVEQRVLLEIAFARRCLQHFEKLAARAQTELAAHNVTSAALDRLLLGIQCAIDEC